MGYGIIWNPAKIFFLIFVVFQIGNVPIPKHFRSLGAKTLPESGKYRYLLNESDQIKLRECSKFHSVQKL